MDEQLVQKVMKEVMKKVVSSNTGVAYNTPAEPAPAAQPKRPMPTEYVGTAMGDTIGLVIANVDPLLHEKMKLDKRFRSIGIVGARVGAGPQIMAADEAVKATNTEIVTIELPRDTKGGAGHGSLIIFGAEEVSDARRAVEVTLRELSRTFGDVYANDAGHLEFQYTARASLCLEKAFGAPPGRAFGLIVGAPAAIGVVICDTAVKAAEVQVVGYASPASGTSFSNESILFISGDSGAVRQALIAAREVGINLLGTLGDLPQSLGKPYI
ncbi:MAG: propanediol utilization microcompartment protein PduB [Eubacteriales bacterium]